MKTAANIKMNLGLVLLAVTVFSCTKTQSVGSRSFSANDGANQAGIEQNQLPQTKFQYALAETRANLPECKPEVSGQIWYVKSEDAFFVCDGVVEAGQSPQWVEKDLRGADGVDGKDGQDGEDGEDGLNSLISQRVLSAGDVNCKFGGLEVTSYLDVNRNKMFDNGIDDNVQISYLCNTGSLLDFDGDGIENKDDNCPFVANPDQKDSDNDGIGDVCDNAVNVGNPSQGDRDGDGIADVIDNCPDYPNKNQVDKNNNGKGDICDASLLYTNVITLLVTGKCEECYLAGYNFSGWNLSNHNFNGSNLVGATFKDTSLVNAKFRGANLTSANFTKANLRLADMKGAITKKAIFKDSKRALIRNFDKDKCECDLAD